MIIEINAFCRLFSEAMHEKDPLKALKADIQKSRSKLIERLYHEADEAGDFLYAPAYCTLAETDDHHAFMALFTDFFEAEDVDISTLRRFKRMVRNALASDSDLEIQEVIANAFEGRLRYFHELNDRIGEELDALAGIAPDNYSESQIKQLEDVFYTLREKDVAGWLRSLQTRNIQLPDELREEALLIVSERRKA